jgi:hypothetical protein
MNRRIALVAPLVVLVLAVVLAPLALASRGGGGGRNGGGGYQTFELVVMDGASQAAHNGRITFDVSTSATDVPMVGLRCYQNEVWIFGAYVGYFPEYLFDQWFTLDSNYWVDGQPATCDARLFYYDRRGREILLGTQSFPVAP